MKDAAYPNRAGGYIIASVLLAKYPILIERDPNAIYIKAAWTAGGIIIDTGVAPYGLLHMRYFENNYGKR